MEHSVDLLAKTFVQAISPSSSQKVLQKMKKALQTMTGNDTSTYDLEMILMHVLLISTLMTTAIRNLKAMMKRMLMLLT